MKLDHEGFRKVLSIKREPLRVCLLTTQTLIHLLCSTHTLHMRYRDLLKSRELIQFSCQSDMKNTIKYLMYFI
jgi:hypothetical protein